MKFKEVLSVFKTFFENDGIADESFANEKKTMDKHLLRRRSKFTLKNANE